MLELQGVSKRFGGIVALQDVDISIRAGRVHALLGENGAGKSTLINLMAGTFPWTDGRCVMDGVEIPALTPQRARDIGVAAVFQEFSLVPDLTVLENVFLGQELSGRLFLKKAEMRRQALALFSDLRFALDLDAKVGDLTRAQKQMVEIAKGLRSEAKVLILDEPTASLTDGEAERLFDAIGDLKARGIGIVYVSHRMPEIRRLADDVTVLRGGRKIASMPIAAVTDEQLIELMVGQPLDRLFPNIQSRPGGVCLRVRDLSTGDGRVDGASIDARAGEIIGIAGLVGCGKSELCRAVFGLQPRVGGVVELEGRRLGKATPRAMLRAGICYFPSDRGAEGLAMRRSARENVTMAALDTPALSRWGILKAWVESGLIDGPLRRLGLRPMAPQRPVAAFSGGNQQKVMLARGLLRPFKVFLFDEPTVGIDVGAKKDVYDLLKALVDDGAAVILATSELPEIVKLANRAYVMRDGRIVAELSGTSLTEAGVLSHYFGESVDGGRAA